MADEKVEASAHASTATSEQDVQHQNTRETSVTTANPLSGIEKHQLLPNVEEFASEHGFIEELPLLRKGALIAQKPSDYEQYSWLNNTELNALRNEIQHRWRQPGILYFTVIMSSVAAVIQGWDQVGVHNMLLHNR